MPILWFLQLPTSYCLFPLLFSRGWHGSGPSRVRRLWLRSTIHDAPATPYGIPRRPWHRPLAGYGWQWWCGSFPSGRLEVWLRGMWLPQLCQECQLSSLRWPSLWSSCCCRFRFPIPDGPSVWFWNGPRIDRQHSWSCSIRIYRWRIWCFWTTVWWASQYLRTAIRPWDGSWPISSHGPDESRIRIYHPLSFVW